MRQPSIIAQLARRLGAYKEVKGGAEFLFCCPYCNTKPKVRLSVNPHKHHKLGKGVFQCWHCGRQGMLRSLCRKVGVEYESATVGDATEYDETMRELMNGTPEEVRTRTDFSLDQEEFYPYVPTYTPAYWYLVKRGFTQEDMTRYRMGLGMGRYQGRIILPEFEGESMIFWQGRSYTNRQPKYLSPTGDKDWHIWNLERTYLLYDDVVITEGVFSGIKAADNSCALYSYNYLPGQVALLVKAGFKTYTIAFDGHLDAYQKACGLGEALINSGVDPRAVRIAFLPEGFDPDDLGRAWMTHILRYYTHLWEPDLTLKLCGGGIRCPDVKRNANCQAGQTV